MGVEKILNEFVREAGIIIYEPTNRRTNHIQEGPNYEKMKDPNLGASMTHSRFKDLFLTSSNNKSWSRTEKEFNRLYARISGKITYLAFEVTILEQQNLEAALEKNYSPNSSLSIVGYAFADLRRNMRHEYVALRNKRINQITAFERSVSPIYSVLDQVKAKKIELHPIKIILDQYIHQIKEAKKLAEVENPNNQSTHPQIQQSQKEAYALH